MNDAWHICLIPQWEKKMVNKGRKVTDEELRDIVMLRGLGFTQKEIGEKLEMSQPSVAYRLMIIHKRAVKDGIAETFKAIIFSPELPTLLNFQDKKPNEISVEGMHEQAFHR